MMRYIRNIKMHYKVLSIITMGLMVILAYQIFFHPTSTTSNKSDITKITNTNKTTKSNALPRKYTTAVWPTFQSLEALVENSDSIIVGRAIRREPGRLVPDSSSSVGMPFMNTSIAVIDVLKGNLLKGEQVVVEQTGGEYIPTHYLENLKEPVQPLPPEAGETQEAFQERQQQREEEQRNAPSKVWLEIKDDPLFVAGERAVLFLTWKSELGVYQIISPQGRFSLDENNKLVPIWQDNTVTKVFDNKSLNVLKDAIDTILIR